MTDGLGARALVPPRPASEIALAAEGAQRLYRAGATGVWVCGSLAHGRHWDAVSDLDYATLGIAEPRRSALVTELSNQLGRNVDVIALEDAPGYVRVQITEAMVPIDRFGHSPPLARGMLEPPATRLTKRPLPRRLHAQRHATALDALKRQDASDVIDAGCGNGELLAQIILAQGDRDIRVTGVDHDPAAIAAASDHLRRTLTRAQRERTELHLLDLAELPSVWHGQDALVAVEVLEHLSEPALRTFGGVVFEQLRPRVVVLTTPNADFNAILPGRGLRDRDHRFEWGRDQFVGWSSDVARRGGYYFSIGGVGDPHPDFGPPTQFAEFRRAA
jgi:SAM-dependent methyltransferase/predicted nucleotidyltransferase